MLPEMRILAGRGHSIFQQDGTRVHTAKDTVEYLKDNVHEFSESENRPPNCPDLKPVDYNIWKICQKECINIKGLGMCNT